MKATTICRTCGCDLPPHSYPVTSLCPACLLRASCTPDPAERGTATTWAEVFPQLEVVKTIREVDGLAIYLAQTLEGAEGEWAVLQVASGERLKRAGGAAALAARVQRIMAAGINGLAPVLDFGDLADAFFLVTEAPGWPRLPEAAAGRESEELSLLFTMASEAADEVVAAAREAEIDLRFEPALCFVDEDCGQALQTPTLLPAGGESARPAAAWWTLEAGGTLAGLRLEERVGEGGFGEVWRARQENPAERTVAVKVLKHGLHSQRACARFEVEQKSLARLDHPHIARFFDGGTAPDERPYFVMEWIDGQSLTRHCDRSNATLSERLRLFRQVGEAVHHAHQKGIIHRDLKPSNVMVAANGGPAAVKVIDFGIARTFEDPEIDCTRLTRANEILGTPASMSPEQAAGAGESELDARTDVYGLGVLLYELLTGKLPFDPKLPADELRRRIREDDPPKPSRGVDSKEKARPLRGDLDWITMRSLEKDPERRYRSVSGLLRDLERHANDEPVEAGPPELGYRLRKFVRRNRTSVGAATAVGLTLILATLISTTMYLREQTALAETARALIQAERALYFGDISRARTAYESGNANRFRELLIQQIPKNGSADYRDWEWYYLRSLMDWSLAKIPDCRGELSISPDKTRVAVGGLVGDGIKVFGLPDGRLIQQFPNTESHITSIAWDPNLPRLITGHVSGSIIIWDLARDGNATRLVTGEAEGDVCSLVRFSPDGTLLATTQWTGVVTIWDSRTLSQVRSWKAAPTIRGLAWSPTQDRLALAHTRSGSLLASVYDPATGEVLFETDRTWPANERTSVAWSPDGQYLAVSGYRELMVFEARAWNRVHHSHESVPFLWHSALAWSPDGQRLVACKEDNAVKLWDTSNWEPLFRYLAETSANQTTLNTQKQYVTVTPFWNQDGSGFLTGGHGGSVLWDALRTDEAHPTFHTKNEAQSVLWNHDGSRLAFLNGRNQLVVVAASGEQKLHLSSETEDFSSISWHPRINQIASTDRFGSVTIFDAESGRELAKLDPSTQSSSGASVSWNTDGDSIMTVLGASSVRVLNLEDGQCRREIDGEYVAAKWSPNGGFLATLGRDRVLRVFDRESKLYHETELGDIGTPIPPLTWSSDSTEVAFPVAQVWKEGSIVICDLASSPGSKQKMRVIGGARCITWHPNGRRLATGSADGQIRIADTETGEELMTIHGHKSEIQSLNWSPDGRRLASADGMGRTVKIWDASPGYKADAERGGPRTNRSK